MKLLVLDEAKKNLLVDIANMLIGLPYKFGAEVDLKMRPEDLVKKRQAIDCSELVEYLYYQIGYKIPDGSYNQYNVSEPISIKDVEIGDLVFRRNKDNKAISHSGLIIEKSYRIFVIEALGGVGVVKRSFSDFSKETMKTEFAGIRRFIIDKIKVL